MNIHHLYGCTPTPLASYLKALGILRLVAEQADPDARGSWQNEHFALATRLTEGELKTFFLEQYAPTPFVSPWNKGSGFLTDDRFLATMEKSPLPRLKRFQEGIQQARRLTAELEAADATIRVIKNEPKQLPTSQRAVYKESTDYKSRLAQADRVFKRLKDNLIQKCRQNWRGASADWLDAAIILRSDGSTVFPAMLGVGGSDGRLDFTNNFMQRFQDLFNVSCVDASISQRTVSLLDHSLFGIAGLGTSDTSIGQFSPGSAGGANSSNGLDGKANVNSWDFLLIFEGAILFAAANSRRLSAKGVSLVSAPFSVRMVSAGHASTSADENSTRGEQWMPLWNQFSGLNEIRKLLTEGRVQLGRSVVSQPVDLARAVARLGVVRGIREFERYAYLERNGMSNFAVPLGRWKVVAQPNQDLLADIDGWLNRFQRAAKEKGAPARLGMLAKRLTDAVMAVAAHGADPLRWQDLLLVLAGADTCLATGTGTKAGVVANLRPGWLAAADDHSPELRLALALAAQYGIRHHWLPLDRFGKLQVTSEGRLVNDPRVVCFGRDLLEDSIALVNRRIVEASQGEGHHPDMKPVHPALAADPRDLAAFLQGGLDGDRILHLARALMALDMSALRASPRLLRAPDGDVMPDDVYGLIRFCLLPRHCTDSEIWRIPMNVTVFRRLVADDLPGAVRLALQHLRSHGLRSPLQMATGDARLLAAAMAFPISHSTRDLLSRVFVENPNPQGEHT